MGLIDLKRARRRPVPFLIRNVVWPTRSPCRMVANSQSRRSRPTSSGFIPTPKLRYTQQNSWLTNPYSRTVRVSGEEP